MGSMIRCRISPPEKTPTAAASPRCIRYQRASPQRGCPQQKPGIYAAPKVRGARGSYGQHSPEPGRIELLPPPEKEPGDKHGKVAQAHVDQHGGPGILYIVLHIGDPAKGEDITVEAVGEGEQHRQYYNGHGPELSWVPPRRRAGDDEYERVVDKAEKDGEEQRGLILREHIQRVQGAEEEGGRKGVGR